jgi:4-amino-4-deoxy-L-arabinose transferase-like glycosyltransferase
VPSDAARTTRLAIVAALLGLLSAGVFLVHTGGHAIHEGDEAIYAEMAREMVDGGGWARPRWQGVERVERPPAAIWVLALARKTLGDERAVRWPLAATVGLEIALLFLLAASLWPEQRWRAAALTVAAFATADLVVGYARYFESEPLLALFVIGAALAFTRARTRPAWIYVWGALLGCAMMTKQVVGGLPVVFPLADALARDEPKVPLRRAALGLLAAAAVWLPWHVYMLAHDGGGFLVTYFARHVVAQAQTGILHTTRPTFYLRELWRSEGIFGVILIAATLWTAVQAVRHRRANDLLIALWALVPLAAFSLAATRFDYYLLVAYPALALAAARSLVAFRCSRLIAGAIVVGWLVTGAALHVARDVSAFGGEDELRALAQEASRRAAPSERLYAYETHPYALRYYFGGQVTTLLQRPEDLRMAEWLFAGGMPLSVEPAADLPSTLARLPRPFLLLVPRKHADRLQGLVPPEVASTRHFLMFEVR